MDFLDFAGIAMVSTLCISLIVTVASDAIKKYRKDTLDLQMEEERRRLDLHVSRLKEFVGREN